MSQGGWQAVSFSLARKHNRNFNTRFTQLVDPILNSTLTNYSFKSCQEVYLLL